MKWNLQRRPLIVVPVIVLAAVLVACIDLVFGATINSALREGIASAIAMAFGILLLMGLRGKMPAWLRIILAVIVLLMAGWFLVQDGLYIGAVWHHAQWYNYLTMLGGPAIAVAFVWMAIVLVRKRKQVG